MDIDFGHFVWDGDKERANIQKHGVDFALASMVFEDPARIIIHDEAHSRDEVRYFCVGIVKGRLMTVRFVERDGRVRIFGAGYWRLGREYYEKA